MGRPSAALVRASGEALGDIGGSAALIVASLPNDYDARRAVALQTEGAQAAWEIARQKVQASPAAHSDASPVGPLSLFMQELLNAKAPVKGFGYLFSSGTIEQRIHVPMCLRCSCFLFCCVTLLFSR